jgi:exosortase
MPAESRESLSALKGPQTLERLDPDASPNRKRRDSQALAARPDVQLPDPLVPIQGEPHSPPASRWAPLLIVIGIVALYIPVLREVGNQWLSDDTYSHGLLVIPTSLFLLWLQRDRLRTATYAPDLRGLGWVVLGLIAEMVGMHLRIKFLMMASLTPVVAGCVLAMYGREVWIVARFPILFLLFAAPIPGVVLNLPGGYIQRASTVFSTRLMDLLGFTVEHRGNVISVPGGYLEVAEACSGFRKLVAMVGFSVFYGYLYDLPLRKRLLLIAAVLPIAIAANITRIAGLIAVQTYWGNQGIGFTHDPADVFVVVISALLFFALGWRLGCVQTRFAQPKSEGADVMSAEVQPHIAWTSGPPVFCGMLLLCAIVTNTVFPSLPPISPHLVPIEDFPRTIGNGRWVSEPKNDQFISDEVRSMLHHADVAERFYHDKQGHVVLLTLLTATDYADFHDPSVCIPAQGWNLSDQQQITLDRQPANLVTAEQSGRQFAVLYWLAGDFSSSTFIGRPGTLQHRMLALRQAITREQGGSLVVRVDSDEANGGAELAKEFALQILGPVTELAKARAPRK